MSEATRPAPHRQPPTRSTPRSPTPSDSAQVAQRAALTCKQLARRCEATADQLGADPLAVVYWKDEADRFRRHAADWDARAHRKQGGQP